MINELVTIYALRDGRGATLYVGQTVDLAKREYAHCHSARFRRQPFDRCVPLRVADSKTSDRIESQIIRAYWRRGECRLNKLETPRPAMAPRYCRTQILCEQTGQLFHGYQQAARVFGISTPRLKNILAAGGKIDYRTSLMVV